MKIEKSSYIEIYNVGTDKYDVVIQYQQYFNILFSEWQIVSIQDKNGLEVELNEEKKEVFLDDLVKKITESEQ